VSRLPYPPICLPLYSSQSTCVICQEGYVPPREERAILLVVDRLKKLACGHVYHVSPPRIACRSERPIRSPSDQVFVQRQNACAGAMCH
jgi:hypothetical protein